VNNPLRAIDLCCGAGGWAVAARGLPIEITDGFDDWLPACETYALNHPGARVHKIDLTHQVEVVSIFADNGRPDVILGGIPCQWISPACGKNKAAPGEVSRQRKLLDSVMFYVDALKPRWWCLEDVIQLRRELLPLTPCQILDAHMRGYSCQARKRLFVGVYPKVPRGPGGQRFSDCAASGPYEIKPSSRRAELVPFGRHKGKGWAKQRVCIHLDADRAPTVLAWRGQHGNTAPLVRDERLPGGIRELTWQEMARLQGFPADYVFVGGAADIGTMIANAVQIDLARAILKAICDEAFPHGSGDPAEKEEVSRHA